jgi:hypothetical protein
MEKYLSGPKKYANMHTEHSNGYLPTRLWTCPLFFFPILFFYYARWGYTVAFTKVLTIYQISHTWNCPLLVKRKTRTNCHCV